MGRPARVQRDKREKDERRLLRPMCTNFGSATYVLVCSGAGHCVSHVPLRTRRPSVEVRRPRGRHQPCPPPLQLSPGAPPARQRASSYNDSRSAMDACRLTATAMQGPLYALLTPFDADGGVDFAALQAYLRFLEAAGVRNVIVNGWGCPRTPLTAVSLT